MADSSKAKGKKAAAGASDRLSDWRSLAAKELRDKDLEELVWTSPDGLSIRRLCHDQGWSKRLLVKAIAEASFIAEGQRTTITPNLLRGIEEHDELIPFQTLRLVAGGRTNSEVADELALSIRTVERHIGNIYGKIGARGRADATVYALTQGLV